MCVRYMCVRYTCIDLGRCKSFAMLTFRSARTFNFTCVGACDFRFKAAKTI